MITALHTQRLSPQPRTGVGACLLRRLGGAVRNAIAGSLSLAGALRRPNTSQTRIGHPVDRNADARPASGHPHAPHTATPVPPRPSWLLRLLVRHHRPAPSANQPFDADSNAPFTPEEFPGLSPEACAFFSTPLEDLDPAILPSLLAAFAEKIADLLPPEAGIADAQELYSTLRDGFAGLLGDTRLGVPTDAQWDAAQAILAETLPDAQVTPAEPSPHAADVCPNPLAAPWTPPLAHAIPHRPLPPVAPAPPREAQATDQPHDAHLAAATETETSPDAAFLPGSIMYGRAPALNRDHSFSDGTNQAFHRCGRLFRRCRSCFLPGLLRMVHARHWCYAARASPS